MPSPQQRWFLRSITGSVGTDIGDWFDPSVPVGGFSQYCANVFPSGWGVSAKVSGNPATQDMALPLARFRTLPLQAQTVSGTVQMLSAVKASFAASDGDPLIKWAAQAWVSIGSTNDVRVLLTDAYRDTGDVWPSPSGAVYTFKSFAAPLALDTTAIEEGDCVVLDVGYYLTEDLAPGVQAVGALVVGTGSDGSTLGVLDATDGLSALGYMEFSSGLLPVSPPPFYDYCGSAAPASVRMSQLPLEVVYDYSALFPYVKGGGRNWLTPPRSTE